MAVKEAAEGAAAGGAVGGVPGALIGGAASFLSSLFGGGQKQQKFQPTDVFSRQQMTLLPESGAEAQLAKLQQMLAAQGIQQVSGGLPPELGLQGIAAGRLPAASQQRIQELSFGGLAEAGRRASAGAMDRALAAGSPLSSFQASQQAELMRPAMEQAAQLNAQLQMAELERLNGLRQTALQNMIAMQAAPALDRLLQIRLAQPIQTDLQMARKGGGLPRDIYGQAGLGSAARPTSRFSMAGRG